MRYQIELLLVENSNGTWTVKMVLDGISYWTSACNSTREALELASKLIDKELWDRSSYRGRYSL